MTSLSFCWQKWGEPFCNVSRCQGSSYPELDKLNLSGLLNVLDGVVDTPGRVVAARQRSEWKKKLKKNSLSNHETYRQMVGCWCHKLPRYKAMKQIQCNPVQPALSREGASKYPRMMQAKRAADGFVGLRCVFVLKISFRLKNLIISSENGVTTKVPDSYWITDPQMVKKNDIYIYMVPPPKKKTYPL